MKSRLVVLCAAGWLTGVSAQSTGPLAVEDRSFPSQPAAAETSAGGASSLNADSAMILLQQMQQYEQEIQTLRGMVEELRHELDSMKQSQKDRYIDLDTRLSALAGSTGSVSGQAESGDVGQGAGNPDGVDGQGVENQSAGTSNPNTDNAADASPGSQVADKADKPTAAQPPVQVDPELDNKAYLAGRNLLLDHQFQPAAEKFEAYLKAFPNGRFRGFSYFWLGEIYRTGDAQQKDKAVEYFQTLIDTYPQHSQVPSALYKLATLQAEQGEVSRAKVTLNKVLIQFPDSAEAGDAKKMLKTLSDN